MKLKMFDQQSALATALYERLMPAEYLLPWLQRPEVTSTASSLSHLLCGAESLAQSIARTSSLPFKVKEVFGHQLVGWTGCGNRLKEWPSLDEALASQLLAHHMLSPTAQLFVDAATRRADQRGFCGFHSPDVPVREKVDALNGFFTELRSMLGKKRYRNQRHSHGKNFDKHYLDLLAFFERVVAHNPHSFVLRFELSYVNLRNEHATAPTVELRLIKDHMRQIESKIRALLGTALVAFVAKQDYNVWEGHLLHWLLVVDEMARHEVLYAREALCEYWAEELAGPTAAFHGFLPGSDLLGRYRGFGANTTLEALGAQLQRAAMYLAGTDSMVAFHPKNSSSWAPVHTWMREVVGPKVVLWPEPWTAKLPTTTLL